MPLIDLKPEICKEIKKETTPQKFEVKNLKNTGSYILISEASKSKVDLPIVGKVQFSRVVINKKIP